jgi:hypothetical protein
VGVALSFSTAIIAVFAAIAMQSGAFSNEALIQKNEAMLARRRPRTNGPTIRPKASRESSMPPRPQQRRHSNPELSIEARKEADRYSAEQRKSATRQRNSKRSEGQKRRVGQEPGASSPLCYAVTMFQVGIALSAIAALSRQKLVWIVGLGIGLLGLLYFIDGFRLYF